MYHNSRLVRMTKDVRADEHVASEPIINEAATRRPTPTPEYIARVNLVHKKGNIQQEQYLAGWNISQASRKIWYWTRGMSWSWIRLRQQWHLEERQGH